MLGHARSCIVVMWVMLSLAMPCWAMPSCIVVMWVMFPLSMPYHGPSCIFVMCVMLPNHTITCGSGCQPVTALAGQCITYCGNIFHVPTSCLPSNVAQSTRGPSHSARGKGTYLSCLPPFGVVWDSISQQWFPPRQMVLTKGPLPNLPASHRGLLP
jgi:hypothetical protein